MTETPRPPCPATLTRRAIVGAGFAAAAGPLATAALGAPEPAAPDPGVLKAPALAGPDRTQRLRLAHSLPASHPVHAAMEFMVGRIAERSGGEIEVAIYANGELGQEVALIEQIQVGRLDIAKVSASVLERVAPAYRVFNVPFLMRGQPHWQATVAGPIGEEILASSVGAQVVGLTFYQAGARSFYGPRPIGHPDDLRGLRIRIQPSPTMVRMIGLFGAQPVQLPWDVTYSALQTGLVDGAENNLAALVVGRHAEVIRFYAFDEHTMVPDVLVMSGQRWARLDERLRMVVREAAWDSFGRMNALWVAFEAEARRASEQLGVAFTWPDKAPFVERTAPMRRDLAGDVLLSGLVSRIEQV